MSQQKWNQENKDSIQLVIQNNWFINSKIPGTKESLPKFVIRFDLQNKSIAITNDKVDPAPPK